MVLVVDDEPVTRRTRREELEPRGVLVVESPDGEEAWERLQKELDKKYKLKNMTKDYQALMVLQETVRHGEWKLTAIPE